MGCINVGALRRVAEEVNAQKFADQKKEYARSVAELKAAAQKKSELIINNIEKILRAGAEEGKTKICIFNCGDDMKPRNEIEKIVMQESWSSSSHPYSRSCLTIDGLIIKTLMEYFETKGHRLEAWERKRDAFRKDKNDSETMLYFAL